MAAQHVAEWSAVGAMSIALGQLGLRPEALVLAMLGAGAWLVMTTSMTRGRALACIAFAWPAGTLAGQIIGAHYWPGDAPAMLGAAFLCGFGAVPLLRSAVAVLDSRGNDVVGAAVDRILAVLRGGSQ